MTSKESMKQMLNKVLTDPVVEEKVARNRVDSDGNGNGNGSGTTVSPSLLFSADADSTTQATLHTLSPAPGSS